MNANELLAYNKGKTDGIAQIFKWIEENEKLKEQVNHLENELIRYAYALGEARNQNNPLQDKLDAIANRVVFEKAQEK